MAIIVVEPGYAGALRTSRVRLPSDGAEPAPGGVITRHVSDLPPEEQARYRPLKADLEAAIAASQTVQDVARAFNRTTNQVCALLDRFGLLMRGYMAYDGAGKRARAVQQQQLESARSDITLNMISAAVREHPERDVTELAADLGCSPAWLVHSLSVMTTSLGEIRRNAIEITAAAVAAVIRRQRTLHVTNLARWFGRSSSEEFVVELRGLGIDLDALRRQALAENPDPQDQAAEEVVNVSVPATSPAEPTLDDLRRIVAANPTMLLDGIARKLGYEPMDLSRFMARQGLSLRQLREEVAKQHPVTTVPPPVAPEWDPAASIPRHPPLDRDNLQAFLDEFPAADFKEIGNHFRVQQRALPRTLDGIGVTADVLEQMRDAGMAAARRRSGAPEAAARPEPPAAADPQPAPPTTDPTPAEPEPTGTPAVPSFASREERYVPDRERLLAYLRANPTAGREAISAAVGVKYHSMESWVRTRFGATLAEVHRQVRRELGLPEELPRAGAGFRKEPEPAGESPAPRAADPVAPAAPAADAAQDETTTPGVEGEATGAEGPLPELTDSAVLRTSPATGEPGDPSPGGFVALPPGLTSSHDPHSGTGQAGGDQAQCEAVAPEEPVQAEAYMLAGRWPVRDLYAKLAALGDLVGETVLLWVGDPVPRREPGRALRPARSAHGGRDPPAAPGPAGSVG